MPQTQQHKRREWCRHVLSRSSVRTRTNETGSPFVWDMDRVPEHIQNHTNDMYLVCKTDCRLVTEITYGYIKTNC